MKIKNMGSSRLPEGKIPTETLAPILRLISKGEMMVSTRIGMDAGITKSHGKYLVFSSGIAVGNPEEADLEKDLVHSLAKRITRQGVKPDVLCPVILFPPGSKAKQVRAVLLKVSKAADNLDITVTKGHTEVTPGLRKLTLILTMYGSGNRLSLVRGSTHSSR